MDASTGFHEAAEALSAATRDRHRALVSLTEELEAIDWYDQRIDATGDEELRAILQHNRDEEKEHAAMLLGWLCRRDATLAALLAEHAGGAAATASAHADGSLGIGALRAVARGSL